MDDFLHQINFEEVATARRLPMASWRPWSCQVRPKWLENLRLIHPFEVINIINWFNDYLMIQVLKLYETLWNFWISLSHNPLSDLVGHEDLAAFVMHVHNICHPFLSLWWELCGSKPGTQRRSKYSSWFAGCSPPSTVGIGLDMSWPIDSFGRWNGIAQVQEFHLESSSALWRKWLDVGKWAKMLGFTPWRKAWSRPGRWWWFLIWGFCPQNQLWFVVMHDSGQFRDWCQGFLSDTDLVADLQDPAQLSLRSWANKKAREWCVRHPGCCVLGGFILWWLVRCMVWIELCRQLAACCLPLNTHDKLWLYTPIFSTHIPTLTINIYICNIYISMISQLDPNYIPVPIPPTFQLLAVLAFIWC